MDDPDPDDYRTARLWAMSVIAALFVVTLAGAIVRAAIG